MSLALQLWICGVVAWPVVVIFVCVPCFCIAVVAAAVVPAALCPCTPAAARCCSLRSIRSYHGIHGVLAPVAVRSGYCLTTAGYRRSVVRGLSGDHKKKYSRNPVLLSLSNYVSFVRIFIYQNIQTFKLRRARVSKRLKNAGKKSNIFFFIASGEIMKIFKTAQQPVSIQVKHARKIEKISFKNHVGNIKIERGIALPPISIDPLKNQSAISNQSKWRFFSFSVRHQIFKPSKNVMLSSLILDAVTAPRRVQRG